MSTEVGAGQSCEGVVFNGAVNFKLIPPLNVSTALYTGEGILQVWREIKPFVERAAEWGRGEYEADDVLVMTYEERMQVWVMREGVEIILVCVTQVLQYPRRKICNIYALAGKRMAEMWKLFSSYNRAWMVANDIDEIQATCRPEIAYMIQPLGFEPLVQVLHLPVKEML